MEEGRGESSQLVSKGSKEGWVELDSSSTAGTPDGGITFDDFDCTWSVTPASVEVTALGVGEALILIRLRGFCCAGELKKSVVSDR